MSQSDTQHISRRRYVGAAAACLGTGLAGCSSTLSGGGGEFPQEDVELVIPYGTGGGYNAYVRLVAPYLEEALPGDSSVVPNNVTGANGRTATNQVYNADPDGHTQILLDVNTITIQQIVYDTNFDVTEMTALPQVTVEGSCIGLAPRLDISTWDEYVSAVQNEELVFGTAGPASGGTLTPIIIGAVSGAYEPEKVLNNYVQYDDKNSMVAGLRRENINVMAGPYSSILPYVESGDVEMSIVGTTDDSPPENTPDALPLGMAGVNNAASIEGSLSEARIFAGPPGMSEDVTSTLEESYMEAFEMEELQNEAQNIDRPVRPAGSDQAADVISNALDGYSQIADLLSDLVGEN